MVGLQLGLTRLDVEVGVIVRLKTREFGVRLAVDNNKDTIVAVPVFASVLIGKNGYSSSEAVRLAIWTT